jgi:hypothetical protein
MTPVNPLFLTAIGLTLQVPKYCTESFPSIQGMSGGKRRPVILRPEHCAGRRSSGLVLSAVTRKGTEASALLRERLVEWKRQTSPFKADLDYRLPRGGLRGIRGLLKSTYLKQGVRKQASAGSVWVTKPFGYSELVKAIRGVVRQ